MSYVEYRRELGLSFYDLGGRLYVDCMECTRHKEQTCSSGNRVKKPGWFGCFSGELISGITPGDLRTGFV
jgi:hypothetical protein